MNDPLGLFEDQNNDPLGLFSEEIPQAGNPLENALGGLEAVGGMISGMPSYIYSGLEGLGRVIAQGGDPTGVTERMQEIQDFRYHPKTGPGKLAEQGINDLMSGAIKHGKPVMDAMLPDMMGEAAKESLGEALITGGLMNMPLLGLPHGKQIKPTEVPKPVIKEPLVEPVKEVQPKERVQPQQGELFPDFGGDNMYRTRPDIVDENGIPINRKLSEDVQMEQRRTEPDLFGEDNIRQLTKQEEIEAAYRQRDEIQKQEAQQVSDSLVYPDDSTIPSQGSHPREKSGTERPKPGEPLAKEGSTDPITFSDKLKQKVREGDYNGALDHIAKEGPSAFSREVASLLRAVNDQFLTIESVDKLAIVNDKGQLRAPRGTYEPTKHKISVRDSMASGDYQVILHEGVHSATAAILDASLDPRLNGKLTPNQVTASRKLISTFREISRKVKEGKIDGTINGKQHYGLTSHHEFIAEAFSSPSFQTFLKGIQLDFPRVSAWNVFVNSVRKMLGLSVDKLNALESTLSIGADLIKSSSVEGRDIYVGYKSSDTVQGTRVLASEAKDNLAKMNGWDKYIPNEKLDYPSVREQLVGVPDLKETPGYLFTNILASGKMQSWMLNHPVVKAIVDSTTGYINNAKLASEKSLFDQNTGVIAQLRRMENLFSPGDAMAVISERLKAQSNKEYTPNLTPEQLKVYQMLDDMFKDRATKINTVLESMGRKPIKALENYFPARWKGEFVTAMWERRADGTKGRLLTYVRETSRGEASKAAEYLNSNYGSDFIIGDVEHMPAIGRNKFQESVSSAHASFEQLLDLIGSEDPMSIKALEAIERMAEKQAMDTMNTKRHFKFKSGVEGSLGDKGWKSPKENYYDSKQSLVSYIETVDQWLAAHQINDFMKQLEADKGVDAPKAIGFGRQFIDHSFGYADQSRAFKEIQNAISRVTGKDASQQRNAVMQYANVQTGLYLGYYSPRGGVQNIIQPLTAVLPKMVEIAGRGGSKDVFSPMFIAMLEAGAFLPYSITKGNFGKSARSIFGKESAAIWDYAVERHIVDPHLVESAGFFKSKGGQMTYDVIANKSIYVTEAFSRYAAFSSLYRHMRASGLDINTALRTAEDVSRELMVNYEPYAKAQVFDKAGLVGQMGGRLQSYKVNQLTQFVDYLQQAKKEGRYEGLSSYLGANIAVAGAVGMIGMDVAEALWDLVQLVDQNMGNPTISVQENSPKELSLNLPHPIAVGGLSYLTNKGLFGAFSTQLIGDNAWQSMFPIYYGIGNQIAGIPKLASDVDTTFASGLQAFAPASVKPMIEEKYLTDEEGKIKSANTGRVVYQKRPNEQAVGNVPTLERGETSLRSSLVFNREKSIKDSKEALLKGLQKLYTDPKYEKSDTMQKAAQRKVDKFIEFGGTPKELNTRLLDYIEGNAARNQINASLFRDKNKPTMKTIRTIKDLDKLKERYGKR